MINLDYAVTRSLNSFVNRSALVDFLISVMADSDLGRFFFAAALVWIWFRKDALQEQTRKRAMVAIGAIMLTVVLARVATLGLPFRLRPIHNPALLLTLPDRVTHGTLDGLSSFPSDTAALCFAMGFGLLWLNRRIGFIALAYASMVAFARVYLGYHYFSDVLGGAAVAAVSMWAVMRMQDRIGALLLPWLRLHPERFYACAFLVLVQIATLFEGMRRPLRELVGLLHY